MSAQVDALLHERERHEIAGRVDRVAEIDAELAALAVTPVAGVTTDAEADVVKYEPDNSTLAPGV